MSCIIPYTHRTWEAPRAHNQRQAFAGKGVEAAAARSPDRRRSGARADDSGLVEGTGAWVGAGGGSVGGGGSGKKGLRVTVRISNAVHTALFFGGDN